jgi:hypothetical protein
VTEAAVASVPPEASGPGTPFPSEGGEQVSNGLETAPSVLGLMLAAHDLSTRHSPFSPSEDRRTTGGSDTGGSLDAEAFPWKLIPGPRCNVGEVRSEKPRMDGRLRGVWLATVVEAKGAECTRVGVNVGRRGAGAVAGPPLVVFSGVLTAALAPGPWFALDIPASRGFFMNRAEGGEPPLTDSGLFTRPRILSWEAL